MVVRVHVELLVVGISFSVSNSDSSLVLNLVLLSHGLDKRVNDALLDEVGLNVRALKVDNGTKDQKFRFLLFDKALLDQL